MHNLANVTIRDLSFAGLGVGIDSSGKTLFVHSAWPGDQLLVKIISEKPRHSYARIIRIEKPSADRHKSQICRFRPDLKEKDPLLLKTCGGCAWIEIKYEKQLEAKQNIVRATFQKKSILLKEDTLKNIWPSPKIYSYRGRAQIKTDGKKLGFYESQSQELVDINSCLVLEGKLQDAFSKLRSTLPNSKWLANAAEKNHLIDIDRNSDPLNSSLSESSEFFQANHDVNQMMRRWLLKVCRDSETIRGNILELFCGSGNFTDILTETTTQKVYAYDSSAKAILALRARALPRCQAEVIDLFHQRQVRNLAENMSKKISCLFLDPPRAGFPQISKTVETLGSNLKEIIYISCNIDSFSRDLKNLEKLGWSIDQIQPLDQFPHTPHIEFLSVLKRL